MSEEPKSEASPPKPDLKEARRIIMETTINVIRGALLCAHAMKRLKAENLDLYDNALVGHWDIVQRTCGVIGMTQEQASATQFMHEYFKHRGDFDAGIKCLMTNARGMMGPWVDTDDFLSAEDIDRSYSVFVEAMKASKAARSCL
jgi:hypothetical protein